MHNPILQKVQSLVKIAPFGSNNYDLWFFSLNWQDQRKMEAQTKKVVIHLIVQDILYHRMTYGVQKYDVHIEFYPDFVTAILELMGLTDQDDDTELTDVYNRFMAKAGNDDLTNSKSIHALAEQCFMALSG